MHVDKAAHRTLQDLHQDFLGKHTPEGQDFKDIPSLGATVIDFFSKQADIDILVKNILQERKQFIKQIVNARAQIEQSQYKAK